MGKSKLESKKLGYVDSKNKKRFHYGLLMSLPQSKTLRLPLDSYKKFMNFRNVTKGITLPSELLSPIPSVQREMQAQERNFRLCSSPGKNI